MELIERTPPVVRASDAPRDSGTPSGCFDKDCSDRRGRQRFCRLETILVVPVGTDFDVAERLMVSLLCRVHLELRGVGMYGEAGLNAHSHRPGEIVLDDFVGRS